VFVGRMTPTGFGSEQERSGGVAWCGETIHTQSSFIPSFKTEYSFLISEILPFIFTSPAFVIL
jgi:hypothetical protein